MGCGRLGSLALGCLLLSSCCGRGEAEAHVEVSMPDVVDVEIGETAVIKCQFSLPENSSYAYINWFSSDKTSRKKIISMIQEKEYWEEDQYKERLSIAEDFSLLIRRVVPQDAKTYICQVGLGSVGVGEDRTELQVSKAPEAPEVTRTKGGLMASDPKLQEIATCAAHNGFPAPSIAWYKNGERLHPEEKEIEIHPIVITESSGLITVRSMLSARVTKDDREALFHCQVNFTLKGKNKTVTSESFEISVHYPSQNLSFVIEGPSQEVKEGDNVTLRCEGDGNPPPEYNLFKAEEVDGYVPPDDFSGRLSFHSVMRNDSGTYQCKALDLQTLEELTASVDLLVNYLDMPTIFPGETQEPLEGEDLIFTCNATGSRPLRFWWERKGKLLAEGAVLNLTGVSYEMTDSNYTCVVVMPEFPGFIRAAHIAVAVRALPVQVLHKGEVSVREGEPVDLTCSFYSVPALNISWSVGNGTVQSSKRNYQYNSTLTVLVSKEILNLGISCLAENELGTMEQHFKLRPEAKTSRPDKTETVPRESSGVIIVAVIVCLLVIAILGAALYFLHKKGKLTCGRSAKQEITRPEVHKEAIVVEVKSDKLPEEAGLLQGANGEKRSPGDQGEKYIDLRN